MIAILDVHYGRSMARTGCVLIDAWPEERPRAVYVAQTPIAREYIAGQFYLRELPCLTAMLARLPNMPEVVLIDGHVWLQEGVPGLGHHLYDTLRRRVVVIGAAKTAFKGSGCAERVLRGRSRKPLYVTADGIPGDKAADDIRMMAGPYRIPLMIKWADQTARGRPGK